MIDRPISCTSFKCLEILLRRVSSLQISQRAIMPGGILVHNCRLRSATINLQFCFCFDCFVLPRKSKPTNQRSSFCLCFDLNWEFGGNSQQYWNQSIKLINFRKLATIFYRDNETNEPSNWAFNWTEFRGKNFDTHVFKATLRDTKSPWSPNVATKVSKGLV